jgi:DNA-directed RNA polymerase
MTRQGELEYESVALGQKRYDAMRQRSESATTACQRVTDDALPVLAQAIDQWVQDAAKPGAAGRKHRAVPYLAHVLPEQAAYLTVRYAIDGASSRQRVNSVALALGTAIEDHLNLVKLGDAAPGLYRKVMQQIRKATSERHKQGVLRHVVEKYAVEKLGWSNTDKLHLGVKLVELFAQTCNIVDLQRDTEGRHNTPVRVVFTPEAQTALEGAHQAWRDLHPVHQPMLIPPRVWRTEERILEDGTVKRWISGGYLTRAIQRARMVQSRLPGALQRLTSGDLSNVYRAVNAVQSTPWRINKPVLAVMQECRAAGPRFASLLAEADECLPPRPAELAEVSKDIEGSQLTVGQREALSSWKRDAAMIYERNGRRRSKRVAAAQKLWVAEKFADEAAIYFPHYLDFRGRIYPYASYLNPQSSDDGRALLEFAEGKPLGDSGLFWLKVHIANLFGIDKVSFEDRVKWVNDNLEKLHGSASSPLDELFWTGADSPWCALAACFELAGAQVGGSAYVSHLPIAMDGSCSGLQHYSAMLRDPVGGTAVNLVPATKPADIYTQVANRAQALSDGSGSALSEAWKGKVVRKIAKQPTMTLCYSATVYGMQGQVARAVEGLGGSDYLDGEDVRQASVYMANIVWHAIGDVVVAARDAMKFLKECSALMAEAELAVCWTAPSGFRVEQGYRKSTSHRVKLHYKGQRLFLNLAEDMEALDPKKQEAGVAPNFVHSLDSAHLMATVNLGIENGLNHWACIHDSFGVHAADVDVLHACIRESFVEQYEPDLLEKFRAELEDQLSDHPELIAKLPTVPSRGTLDLAAVREARYFFA